MLSQNIRGGSYDGGRSEADEDEELLLDEEFRCPEKSHVMYSCVGGGTW